MDNIQILSVLSRLHVSLQKEQSGPFNGKMRWAYRSFCDWLSHKNTALGLYNISLIKNYLRVSYVDIFKKQPTRYGYWFPEGDILQRLHLVEVAMEKVQSIIDKPLKKLP